MTFFDYCFYRISRGYQSTGEKHAYDRGWSFLTLFFTGYICLFLALIGVNVERHTFVIVLVIVGLALFFIFTPKKFQRIKIQRQNVNEKYYKLKGWLIGLMVVSSVAAYVLSLIISS